MGALKFKDLSYKSYWQDLAITYLTWMQQSQHFEVNT